MSRFKPPPDRHDLGAARRSESGIRLLGWQARLDVLQLFLQLPHLVFQALEAGGRGRRAHRRPRDRLLREDGNRDGSAEQVRVARIAATGFARQPHDERPIRAAAQALERRLYLPHLGKGRHAGRAGAQLSGGLRSADEQLADNRELLRRELQWAELGVAEPMLVLRYPTAEA